MLMVDFIVFTMKGCPVEVGGDFYCHNNNLTSLEGCPVKVGGSSVIKKR